VEKIALQKRTIFSGKKLFRLKFFAFEISNLNGIFLQLICALAFLLSQIFFSSEEKSNLSCAAWLEVRISGSCFSN